MASLIDRAGRRNLARNPWQLMLAVSGIALGVAVVVGVDMANSSIERAFSASSELVAGRATHQVVPVQGRLPDSLYVELRTEAGLVRAAPVLEASVRLSELPEAPVTLQGVDLFAETPFRPFAGAAALDIETVLLQPGAAVIPYGLANRLAAGVGDAILLDNGGVLTVAGILSSDSVSEGLSDGFVIVDIASAQELLDAHGELSRIDLILDAAEEKRVQRRLAPSQLLLTTGPRTNAMLEMTRGFRTNLTAMSLMAVLVGAFLIYNTMAFLVVRRIPVTGMFRALGVTRQQVFIATLKEAFVIGAAGTVIGLAVGTLLGSGLVTLALRTVNDIYFSVAAAPGALNGWVLAKGIALGLLGTLVAAAAPAWEASTAPPRASLSRAGLEQRSRQRAGRAAWLSFPFLLFAAFLLTRDTGSLTTSFAGLFVFAIAATMLTPMATAALMAGLRELLPRGSVMGRLAARGVTAGLSRTGVAVSALMLAVATVIGVGLMIASFRGSVVSWLENVVQADFYLSATDRNAPEAAVTDALLARVAALPGVTRTGAIRHAWVPVEDGQRRIWAIEPASGAAGSALGLMLKSPAGLTGELAGGAVLVSEPYSNRHGVDVGDVVRLPTPAGERGYAVAGIFVDYSSDRGVIAMHRQVYRRDFDDDRLDAIRAYVEDDRSEAVREQFAAIVAHSNGALQMTASGELRELSLEIFDRTFTITEVLRVLAGAVAFLGVLSALQALALERSREFATLRAIGFSPRQLLSLIIGQTGLLGLAAGLLAIPTGMALAALLVHVINQRAFGWSMQMQWPLGVMLQGLLLALAAAVLAGIYPAWRSAGATPARGLREE